MTYDVGTAFYPGYTTRPDGHRAFLQSEIATIRDELHCSSVMIFGSEIDRLFEGATAVATAGLHAWVQPRFIDEDAELSIERIVELARGIEALTTPDRPVVLNLGCELALFASGFVPGRNFDERFATIMATLDRVPEYNERLSRFLGDAATKVRPHFSGPITYSAGAWEEIDWSPFDIVSINLYRDAENAAKYAEDVRALGRFGKPVAITEFGCCSFQGAEELGGSGYTIVDAAEEPPVIPDGYIRDEDVQARYIGELIDIHARENVFGSFVYTFIEPDSPHTDDPRSDMDMAGFAVVKVYGEGAAKPYAETGYWEPKRAFETIAERFARLSAG